MTFDYIQLAALAWNQLWQVTLVALVVAILVKAFGHRRPHLAYLLWLLVIAKCLTPPVFSSPTGVFSWARMETRGVTEVGESTTMIVMSEAPLGQPGSVHNLTDSDTPAHEPSPLVPRDPSTRKRVSRKTTTEPLVALPAVREEEAARRETAVISDTTDAAPAQASFSIPWPIALALIWVVGAAVCAATILAKHLACAWTIWRSSEPADEQLATLVAKLSDKLGIRRDVRLMITQRPLGPAVFGIFRPTILLPASLTSPEFSRRIEPIIAHELIHFRRGDTFLGVLQLAAQILWWFHPLVWWASREATRERERCCDEEAVAGLRCEPGDYAQTLLDVLRSKRKLEPVFAQPGVRPVDITARRLEHIMQGERGFHHRTPVWYWIVAVLVAAVLLPGGGLVIEAGAATDAEIAFNANGEWAQYGGSSYRNNTSDDTGLPEKWDVKTGKNIKWTAPLGNAVYSSPIMADGKIFIGTNNNSALVKRLPRDVDVSVLVCVDAETGEFLWQHANEKLKTGRVHDWPELGICSTSCVEGKRLWYVNNRNELVCLDTDGFHDGKNDGPFKDEPLAALDAGDVIWKLDMMSELGVSQHNQSISSVTIAGDLIFAGTSHGLAEDHLMQPPDAPSFIAVNKDSGKVVWRDKSPSGNILHGQWSSPAYGVIGGVEQVVFCGGDGWIYGFDVKAIARGETKLLWKFDGNPKESKWILGGRGARNNAIAIPMIHKDRVFMTMGQEPEHGEGDGHVWCIDATKRGDISAELVFNEADPAKVIPHKRVQAADPEQGDVVKPNPNSGVVWHFDKFDLNNNGEIEYEEEMHRSFSSVVVRDGLAIIPDFGGIVHCLDAETGEPLWHYDLLTQVWATPYVADGKIYIGDDDAKVTVFALSKELDVLAQNELERSQYTTIMSVNGTLFIPSVEKLIAVEDPELRVSGAPQAGREVEPAASAVRLTRAGERKGHNWPSSRGNPQNTGVAGGELPDKLEMIWKMKTENRCEATPVVVDGIAYIADLDSVYAIDTRTGEPQWKYRNPEGFDASPLIFGSKLYVGDADGTMHSLDAATGELVWKFGTGSAIFSAANAVDGLVVFAGEDGTVFALQPTSGKLVWKANPGTQLKCAPAISGKRVVVAGCDSQLYVLDLETGKELLAADIEGPTGASPAVRDGLVYFGTLNGLLCVEIDTGKIRWRYEGKELGQLARSSVAVTEDRVIVAGDGKAVVAIDIGTGEAIWRYVAKAGFESSPVVVDDHVLIGSKDGRLYVLDEKTGEAKLVYETGSSLIGSVAVADGQLLLAGAEGVLYCFGNPNQPAAQKPAARARKPLAPRAAAKPAGDRTFRIESLGKQPVRIESSKNDGKEQLLVDGRSRFTLGRGNDAIVAESDRAVIRGAALNSDTDWQSLELVLEGNVVLHVGKSKLQAEKIRYLPANRQFELDDVGTLQLPPKAKAATKGPTPFGLGGLQGAQELFGIGGKVQLLAKDPNAKAQQVQVKFSGLEGMVIHPFPAGDNTGVAGLILPGRLDFQSSSISRLKLSQIPERAGVELYPTLEIGSVTGKTKAYLEHNAISVRFTEEDFDQALAGNFVTKVIYLPDLEFQESAIAGVESVVSTRLDPGVDPIVEADRRGTIIAVVRLGNREVVRPGTR